MTGIISPEETMEHAQQAAADRAADDVADTTVAVYNATNGDLHVDGVSQSTMEKDVDGTKVAAIFTPHNPFA